MKSACFKPGASIALALICSMTAAVFAPARAASDSAAAGDRGLGDRGLGDRSAARTASASPRVAAAMADIRLAITQLRSPGLRAATADAIENRSTCIAHRRDLGEADKTEILHKLADAGLIDPAASPAQQRAGVFPPVLDDGGPCPHLPQPFAAAPGGDWGSHHSWPGGLAAHTALNARIGRDLALAYRRQTGTPIDVDRVVAAALWHDWAKTLVFQWTGEGREIGEIRLGGIGKDGEGDPAGDSRTGAHHILSLAEAMRRGLPPAQVLVQACAHAAPTDGQAYKLVNWLRAAAIIARLDPVAAGYLRRDPDGGLHPAFAASDAVAAAPDGPWPAECLIHFQSDQNWVYADPAVRAADAALARLAGRFGYDPNDSGRYLNDYRNVAMSRLGADRIQALGERGGLAAVAGALERLRRRGLI